MTLTVSSPQELLKLGYEAEPLVTLETTEAYTRYRASFDKWIRKLPGLRTPRALDGTGGTPPRPHQLRHAAIACQRPVSFLAHSMGTGKTGASIIVMLGPYGDRLFAGLRGQPDGALELWLAKRGEQSTGRYLRSKCELGPGTIQIMTPGHVSNVWLKELERMNLGWACQVLNSEADVRESQAPIWIYNYDFVKRQTKRGIAMRQAGNGTRFKHDGSELYFWGHPVAKLLNKRYPPSLLVLDEIHRCRKDSDRTELVRLVRSKAKRVVVLTGTPMDGWVEHTAAILGTAYREKSVAYPYKDAEFAKRFTNKGLVNLDVGTGRESAEAKRRPVPGVSAGQIPAFMQSTVHTVHRLNLNDPEVLANVVYPKANRIIEEIYPDLEHQLLYQDVYKNGLEELKAALLAGKSFQTRNNMLTLINRLRMASVAPWELDYRRPDTALVRRVVEIVKQEHAQGKKGLIGCTFVAEGRYIHEALQRAGLNGTRLYVKDSEATPKAMNRTQQAQALERFMDDPAIPYLLSNKELVAEGHNMAESTGYLVSTSQGFRSNIEDQWEGRVIRPGQPQSVVNAYSLVNQDMVCVYIFQLIMRKRKATRALVDLEFDDDENLDSLAAAVDIEELSDMIVNHPIPGT